MARDNSSSQLDEINYQIKGPSASVYFEDELEKSPKLDCQNKERKFRHVTLAEEDSSNTVAWRIDSQEKLCTKMDRNFDGVLTIILEMCTIYTKYLDQGNHADKQCNQIQTIILKLEQKIQISNNEKQEAITVLEAQVAKSNGYEKIINTLQNSLPAKQNQSQQLVKRLIAIGQTTVFVHDLSPLFNDQRSITRTLQPNEIGSIVSKLTRVLSHLPLFIDRKNPSIDQGLSKMRSKFETNGDHYPSEGSKLIYAENGVGEKALQYLEPCLRLNSITFFTTIEDLFNYLKAIFGNPHQKN